MTDNKLSNRNLQSDEIDLLELWQIIWHRKWLIIAITAVFAVSSVYYALWLPDVYRAEVLLSPAEETNRGAGGALLGQLGGLASLAGVDIGSGADGTTKKVKAIATLQSRAFIKEFFTNHDLTVPFMASRPTGQSGVVEIDPELYDQVNQRWVREVEAPLQAEPTDGEIYREFSEILIVEEDTTTGLVTVSLEWYDPVQIQQWVTWMIQDLNEKMRQSDLEEARRAIDYLNGQLARTQLLDMRNVLYSLIEQQTQTVMLADARPEYVFQTLDPAVVPEQKSAPRRSLICIIGTLLGGALAIMLAVLLHVVRNRENLVD